MEKFLFTFKLSKGVKFIGWLKFVVSCLIAIIFLVGSVLSAAVLEIAKKALKSESDSSNVRFYCWFVLTITYILFYAVFSFVLIIGTINHDRLKVLGFLLYDGSFTCLMTYILSKTFPNVFVILMLIVQGYFMFCVYSYWKVLQKVHKDRKESQVLRARVAQNREPLKQVVVTSDLNEG